jgi:hypothetical protein
MQPGPARFLPIARRKVANESDATQGKRPFAVCEHLRRTLIELTPKTALDSDAAHELPLRRLGERRTKILHGVSSHSAKPRN